MGRAKNYTGELTKPHPFKFATDQHQK
jgi:hypothetical protein